MKQVEIPGGTATLRETSELRGRDRMLVKAASMAARSVISKMLAALPSEAVAKAQAGDEEAVAEALQDEAVLTTANDAFDASLTWEEWLRFLEFRQSVVVAQLVSWTREEPLPTMSTIGDLPADLFDALDAAVGGVPASVAETDFSPSPDSDSPTSGSSDLSGPSEDKPSIPSMTN
jgi:hypothetical protein